MQLHLGQDLYSYLQLFAALFTTGILWLVIVFIGSKIKSILKLSKIHSITVSCFIVLSVYLLVGVFTYNKKSERIGAICCDETISYSTGPGACSWHGGVDAWKVKYSYKKYAEPYNTVHKIFYFWYALNENHVEEENEICDGEEESSIDAN